MNVKKKSFYFNLCVLVVWILSIFLSIFIKDNYINVLRWLELNYSSSSFRSILEIIYFITSPLLLAVAVIGLRQIDIAKETSILNDKRTSFTLAAEQCRYFIEKIIPEVDKISISMEAKGIKNFGKAKLELNDKKEKSMEYTINNEPGIAELQISSVYVLNLLDGFSTFFIAGVAEETVAFSALGITFVQAVDKLFPILCWGQDETAGYNSLISLYIKWKDKIEKQKAIIEKS